MKAILKKIYHLLPYTIRKLIKSILFKINNIYNMLLQIFYRKEFLQIIEENKLKIKGVIIYLPTIDWETSLFQKPQQIALKISDLDYLFFYITPNIKEKIKGIKMIKKNLIVTIISSSFLFNLIGFEINVIIYISWAPIKYMLPHSKKYSNKILLYDYIDELEIFYQYDPETEKDHNYLLKNSDIVLVTTDNLYKKAKSIREDVVLCPNGCDYDHFSKTKNITMIPNDLKKVIKDENIIVGYHGTLAEWIDYQLIEYIAKNLNNSKIILIGPDYDESIKKSNNIEIKNIHWLGPKPYQDLPKYLKWFDIAILPFKVNKITMSASPIKLFEYMASGIPIVSIDLPEPKKYKSVLTAKNYKDFVELIIKAKNLKNNKEYLELLDKEAKENSWFNRIKIIDEIIQNKIKQKFIINNNNE